MIRASLRDLRWRRRRFIITVTGAALVFSLTMLLGAIRDNFVREIDRTLDALGAEQYVVDSDAAGPFSGFVLLDVGLADKIDAGPGGRAGPLILVRQPLLTATKTIDANIFGHRIHGAGEPEVADGRSVEHAGEIVVDRAAGIALGETLTLGGARLRVVGRTQGRTLGAGSPDAFLSIEDAQRLFLGGRPVATMLIVDGDPGHTPTVPAGLTVSSRAEAHKQLLRPWGQAINSLTIFAVLLWVVAAAIVGSALYLSAIERTRDFAVFRATGSTTRALVAGLLAQAAVLTSASGVLAIVIAVAISPVFPLPVTVTLSQMVVTLVVSIVVGLFAAMTGLRRAVSVEPALAFAGRT